MSSCITASFGFDIDFIFRRLKEDNVKRLICLGVKVDAQNWARVEKSFSLVKHYCEAVRIHCSLESISPGSIVREIRSILASELENCESLELFLTGGPRILVIGSLLAAISLPETLSTRINVRVEGEAFEAILKFNTGTLKQYLSLDDISKRIVEATVDPKRVSNIIRETNLPKSTVYRRIERLTASRILEKKDEKVYVAEENLRKLIDIIRG
ncbi:MAG: hypothetical protein QXR02_06345 [Acidilobaceae archaeon]